MTRIIMHGCNGHMGQVITGIVAVSYTHLYRLLPRELSRLILLEKYFLKKILNAMMGKKHLKV